MTARAVSRTFVLVVALLIALFAFAFAQSAYADPAPDLQAGGSEGLSDELQTQGGMSKPWGPLQYKIDYDKHTVVFTGYSTKDGVKQQPATITIPAEIEGCTDISIQYGAFRQNENLQTVKIKAAVKTIPGICFYKCPNLETVELSDSVESIDERAFSDCTNLKTVKLGASLAEIGEKAFFNCQALESITLPNTLAVLGVESFKYCLALKSIEIPSSMTEIPTGAFSDCKALATVTLHTGLQTIGEHAFDSCESIVSIELPGSVTTIGEDAFRYAKGLTSAKLPDGLVTLGESAFSYCGKLSDIGQIPATLTTVGDYAFSNCAFEYVAVPDTIKEIPAGMFFACTKMKSIALPDTLTKIGKHAFASCKSLEYLRVPAGVTFIGNNAFQKVDSAKIVYFENGDHNWPGMMLFGDAGYFSGKDLTIVCAEGSANGACKLEAQKLGAAFKTLSEAGTFTVKHDANGGTGTMADVTLPKGFAYALPLCKFTKASADFKEWKAPGGKTYQPGQAMPANGSATMTATAMWDDWTETGWKVTFAPGSGSDDEKIVKTVKKDSSVVLPTCPFTPKPGYVFAGWRAPYQGEAPWPAGAELAPLYNGYTFTAQWVSEYTVTFDARGGTVSPGTMKTDGKGRLIAWPEVKRAGYILEGWSDSDDLAHMVSLGKVYTANTKLYAVWDKLPEGSGYVVSFDANGGTLAAGEEAAMTDTAGKLASLPAPTRDGYDFAGWYLADMTTKVTTGTVFAANTKVYAAWTEKSSGGGSGGGGGGGGGAGGGGGGGGGASTPGLDTYKGAAAAFGFEDLDPAGWYMNAPGGAFPAPNDDVLYIDYTVGNSLMTGTDPTHFSPDANVSRAMMAMVLFRLGNPGVANGADPNTTGLSDVEGGQWYTRAVNWCVANGVVTGYKDANGVPVSFAPDNPVSREEMATMVARFCVEVKGKSYVGDDVTSYPDYKDISEWAHKGVAYCKDKKIMTGNASTGYFNPHSNSLRCELSKVIAVTAHMLE